LRFIKSYIFLVFLFVLGAACTTFLKMRYGVNKHFNFTTKESYLTFLRDKKNIDTKNVLVPDSNSIPLFMGSIINDSLSIYYGCLINDSVELKKTKELSDNLSCMGRILEDISLGEASLNKEDSSLFVKSQFNKYHFYFLQNGEKLDINQSNSKLKIILLYSYSLGRYFDRTFNEVRMFHESHKKTTTLYIITLDDISRLQ